LRSLCRTRGGRTDGRVKIRDDERAEPPHVTILHRTRAWRLALRTGMFLDREPPPRDVPRELEDLVWGKRKQLRKKWDEMYPENPVFSQENKG
jgi:hypothetical protein